MENFREQAIQLLEKNTNYKREQILKIKQIHRGYTNLSFLFKMQDKTQLQIRLGQNNQIVDRQNEIRIISYLPDKLFLYIDENGNAIKKWIYGYNPSFRFNKRKLLRLLCNEIIKLHNTDISKLNIVKHDYSQYFTDSIKKQYPEYSKRFEKLLEKHKNIKLVFSHNDTNPWNLIYAPKENKIYLIDFEWARINADYFDYVNFFRETNLNIKWLKFICDYSKLDFEIAKDFLFICTFFALQWTYKVNETEKLLKYRKGVIKKLDKFSKILDKKQ